MFPQGTLVHQESRPIACEPGIGILARSVGTAWLCPVAYRYELLREQRGEIRVLFGEPQRVAWSDNHRIRDVVDDCSLRLTLLADQVRDDALQERSDDYEVFLRGPLSMEQRFDKLLGRSPGR